MVLTNWIPLSHQVPAEFQTQYPSYANPPTLVLALTKYIAKLKAQTDANTLDSQLGFNSDVQLKVTDDIADAHLNSPDLAESYLRSIYPALRRHYLWFRRTQKGQLREWNRRPKSKTEAYRWRGRTEEHVLTSGLDDYPRAKPPHSGELHVDLMSWVGFFARTMGEVAEYLDEADDLKEYRKHERGVLANLDELHWSEQDKAYCDVTVDEDGEHCGRRFE
jgi:mannosyl-oligosaccharide glucosidase